MACQPYAMNPAALLLAAAATLAAPQPESRAEGGSGVQLAQAKVSAVILEPAIVRQASGLQRDADAPRVQVSRYDGKVLFEFQ